MKSSRLNNLLTLAAMVGLSDPYKPDRNPFRSDWSGDVFASADPEPYYGLRQPYQPIKTKSDEERIAAAQAKRKRKEKP